jgi:dGTPase
LDGAKPQSVDDIRRLGGPVVAFSEEMRDKERALKRFLFTRMYRHERVMGAASEAKQVVRQLFDAYLAQPALLPAEWRANAPAANSPETARLVADYIAGMTDLYAFDAHERLTGSTSP